MREREREKEREIESSFRREREKERERERERGEEVVFFSEIQFGKTKVSGPGQEISEPFFEPGRDFNARLAALCAELGARALDIPSVRLLYQFGPDHEGKKNCVDIFFIYIYVCILYIYKNITVLFS